MSSKKKNNKKEKDLKKVEKNEESSEIIKKDENEDDSENIYENEENTENIEDREEDSEEEETEEDSDEEDSKEEDSKEEETEEDSDEEDSKEEETEEDSKEEEIEEDSEEEQTEEKSEKSKDTKKEKKKVVLRKEDSDEPDYFWVKVLVVTIVIVWAALIAGSWAGNYFLKSDFFKKYNSQVVDDNKPKVWKTIVEVDKSGAVSKSAVLADNTDDLQIDDFRNTNEPIPGIDDQSLKNLKDIEPLQEPSDDSSSIEIQIASEETMESANKIAEDLKSKGYNPMVEPFTEDRTNKYRVKISETSTDNANKKIEELKTLNYKPFIIGK